MNHWIKQRPLPIGLLLGAACALVGLAGCGSGRPQTAKVEGKVTYAGQPVTFGEITFYPRQGRSATGRIQADGTYRLTTFSEGDGALLGQHTVTIKAVKFPEPANQPKSMNEEIARDLKGGGRQGPHAQPHWLVPSRYAQRDTSGLKAEVRKGPNTCNFDLPGQ
jgi:hypothetical protein